MFHHCITSSGCVLESQELLVFHCFQEHEPYSISNSNTNRGIMRILALWLCRTPCTKQTLQWNLPVSYSWGGGLAAELSFIYHPSCVVAIAVTFNNIRNSVLDILLQVCGNFLYICMYNCNTVFCSVQLLTHLIRIPVSAVYNGTEAQLNKDTICIPQKV